jgi:hypothetical protein
LMECCRLRINDIDFSRNEVVVRSEKETKIAIRCCQAPVHDSLMQHVRGVKAQHDEDLKHGVRPGFIRFVILSRLICWRMVTISERFKSCWGTMT